MPPCPDMGQSVASPNMKQLLLICAVVALVGCGKKEDGNTGVVKPNKPLPKAEPEKLITNSIVEKAIRWTIGGATGELTKADLEKVTRLHLADNQLTDVKELEKLTQLKTLYLSWNKLTDVKGLEKLTQLKELYLRGNPDLTKAQIDQLKKALPKCKITSNPTK